MFKGASETKQRRASAISFADIPANFEDLAPEQQRDNLKAIMWAVEEEILGERCPYRRKELGRRKFQLQEQMRSIRPKSKMPGVSTFFIDVAKERLPAALYKSLMDEASDRFRVALAEGAKK